MTAVRDGFAGLSVPARLALVSLALLGEPAGKVRIGELLAKAGLGLDATVIAHALVELMEAGQVRDLTGRGFVPAPDAAWLALREALDTRQLATLRKAYLELMPVRLGWEGQILLRSYRQGVALLRLALIEGEGPERVQPILAACLACHEAGYLHPLIETCVRPFDPELIARIHPLLRADVLAILLENAQREPHSAAAIRAEALRYPQPAPVLRQALAADAILGGRFTDALQLAGTDGAQALHLQATVALLRDDFDTGLALHEQAIKQLRRDVGKRKVAFAGIGAHLYVLAQLRGADTRNAEALLDAALKAPTNADTSVYQQLHMLRQIRAGLADMAVFASRSWESLPQPVLFRALIHDWLGLPQLGAKRELLDTMCTQMQTAGYDWIVAQLAAILANLGSVRHEQLASALRREHGFADISCWFAREEAWERALNALINLQPATNMEAVRETRLVWLLRFDPHYGIQEIEPREQKRDSQGGWTKGRAVSLKRLAEDGGQLDYLSTQDLLVLNTVRQARAYYSGSGYELDLDEATAALVGHPLLFWADAPGTRVELLPGEPELRVKAKAGQVLITMEPPLPRLSEDVLVTREAPNRLRVVSVKDEHRRVATIVGDGLVAPLHAERKVLEAIGAVSSLVTVQSDIGASAADLVTVDADPRLHVHLLPYQQGLRMQILVRPLREAGAWYAPGSGAESVIAELAGVRTEAKRNLQQEHDAERTLIAACHALDEAHQEHGEWLLGHPAQCLELVAELQQQDPEKVVLAWPEGESFRVNKRSVSSRSLRLTIERKKDWFAVDGDIEIDEGKVLGLRQLLDLMRGSESRFVALGERQFLELSEELARRLRDLADFSDDAADGLHVHPLSTFALEDLAVAAGGTKSDKAWRAHLKQIASQASFQPELPSTLQADLRDYQREGFDWLARLAHWGIGACLADDMGLGKTVQALGLLLSRAPDGPALVIAPTSVCNNWQAEALRFAPTLNVKLFGEGDRKAMIEQAGAFDLIIASYGLLQQEATLFARQAWHTIVLDEAQAIKNTATKRSAAVMGLQGRFRLAMTGTPLENHLGELWNLFRFINPGLLGSQDQFHVRYAVPIEKAQDKRAEAGARNRLRKLIQPFVLRRTKAQVLTELPARTEIMLPIEQTVEEAALYESLRRNALEKLASLQGPESQKSIQILAEMMKLRRACCNPALVAPELNLVSSKMLMFERLIDELLDNRHKVLVFSQFVDHLALLRSRLDVRGVRYQYLDGATSAKERKRRIDAFQAGDGDVFLISLKAGGVGINLTAADYVIHMDPWWNPAVEDQASDRAHRLGQLRPVTIYRLVSRNTIEEGIVELHKQKRDLADSLLEGSDAAARMSPAQMLKMLQEGLAGRARDAA